MFTRDPGAIIGALGWLTMAAAAGIGIRRARPRPSYLEALGQVVAAVKGGA